MNEADRKFTQKDKVALAHFFTTRHKSTADHADAFVRTLPVSKSIDESLHPLEDISILNSEEVLLERFFEEHFIETPNEDYPEEHKRMHAGFHFWQNVIEEELFILNSPASLDCAEIIRSLSLADVYKFARNKEEQLKAKRSKHIIGSHDFNFLSESCRRWTTYSNIALGALHHEANIAKQ